MRWSGLITLLATSIVAGAHADEPTWTARDVAREIAWARATWPDDLKGIHFHSPLGKLLAWVPRGGSLPVYLYTDDFSCRRATLARDERRREDDNDDPDGGPVVPPTLTARINGRARVDDGDEIRDVTLVAVGEQLSREDSFTITETKNSDGRWHVTSSGGIGFTPIVYGALSYADDRVARWDGEPTVIHPYCDGPVEWLTCPGGGERPCERCEQVALLLAHPRSLWGHSRSPGKRKITCKDRCPTYPESPDKTRLERLGARVPIWRPRKAPIAAVPSIYKSRDDCRRDHPQPGAR